MDPYLVLLIVCFKMSIHLLPFYCVTISARCWPWVRGHGRVVWIRSQASQPSPGLWLCGEEVSKSEHQRQTPGGQAGSAGGPRVRASLRKEKKGVSALSLAQAVHLVPPNKASNKSDSGLIFTEHIRAKHYISHFTNLHNAGKYIVPALLSSLFYR